MIKTTFLVVKLLMLICLTAVTELSWAQSVQTSGCPFIDKRNNGNGQYSSAAGNFPSYGVNNPVASNVAGTTYQTVLFDPTTKTGLLTLAWTSATPITNFPIISRTWLAPNGSTSATLSPIVFGPPSPPVVSGQTYYADYCFYVQNLPLTGTVTFEFTDPQTQLPIFNCAFDLHENTTTTIPVINCAPTITQQPANLSLCNAASATFTVSGMGISSVAWQVSANGSSSWSTISNGGDYSGATTTTLTISNPVTYSGNYYRAVLTGSSGCGSVNSNAALLIARPKPQLSFNTISLCGLTTQSMGVTITGTAPWSFTYTTSPGGTTATISNIAVSPFYFSVNPAVNTTYTVTQVSDAYCINAAPSGNINARVSAPPAITPQNVVSCYASGSFSIPYTATGSPDQYTLSAGVRVLPGFSTLSLQNLSSSPLVITIPSNTPVGTYDFNIVALNSTTNCSSESAAFTLTVRALPQITATAAASTVCSGTTTVLNAAPSNLSTYSWSSNPVSSVSSVYNPTVTVNATTNYTVTATDAFACSGTATVTVTASPGPTLSISPSSPSICSGNATTLTVTGGNTYSWNPTTGLSASTGDIVVASPSATTTYYVTSENVTGCQSVGSVTVTVSQPNITATASETICAGTVKTLTASGGSTYAWYPLTGLYTNAAATVAYTGTSLATVYAKPTATTTYYVQGTTAGGCQGIASSTVTISPAPVNTSTSTGSNLIFCTQGTSSFDLTVNTTTSVSSMAWTYSANGSTYYSISSPSTTSIAGMTFTPTITSNSAVLNITGYGSSAYGGERYFRLTIVGSLCTYQYDIFVTDTKGTNPTPVPSATQTTICSGNSTTLNAGNLATGSTVQWQSSSNNSTWADITGATSSVYSPSPVSNTYYRAKFNGGTGNCGSFSTSILITVISGIGSNTVTPATTCTNGSGTITLSGSAITSGIYQWQMSSVSGTTNFSDILGASSQNYTLPNNIVPDTRWFRRIASTSSCATDFSTAVAVYAPISNNQITNNVISYCGTASATSLTGTTPLGGSGTYTYQWMSSSDGVSFSNVASGGTSKDYTTPVQSQTFWYKRNVSSGGCSDESNVYKITVNPVPSVTCTANSTICAGASLSLTASGASSYAWSPSTELSASTGSTVMSNATATRTYTVTGTSTGACTNTATTTVTVTALPASPTLSSTSVTLCSGSVNLTSYVTSGGVTEWYTVPAVNPSYLVASPGNVSSPGTYYVFSKNASCYSSANGSLTFSHANVTPPVLAGNSLSYCAPATADLTALQPAQASGTTLQWHTVSSGPAPANLVASPSAVGSGTYYLYAYSTAGSCYGGASSAATVTINTPAAATVSPTIDSVCQPTVVNLNNYNTTPGSNTYNWYTSSTPNPANLVMIPEQVTTTGTYYLVATTSQGCQGAPSTGVAITFNPLPSANISSPEPFCGSVSTSIFAYSDAVNPVYQWEISSDNGSTWTALNETSPYSGVHSPELSINPTSSALSQMYYRYIVNSKSNCTSTSVGSLLIEEASPVLYEIPPDTSVYTGTPVSLSATAGGCPAFSYEWKVSNDDGISYNTLNDSNPYMGSTSGTLTITNSSLIQDSSLFKVSVSNSCGAMISQPILVTLKSAALPVTWLNVEAVPRDKTVAVQWETASECNSQLFKVLRSADCQNWDVLGLVQAAGNSTTNRKYSFVDQNPFERNFYRLQQIDFDGKVTLSKIVTADLNRSENKIVVFPNPVWGNILNVQMPADDQLYLYNSTGVLVLVWKCTEGSCQIDISQLAPGIYYIRTLGISVTFSKQ
jgi:hypothetical protein